MPDPVMIAAGHKANLKNPSTSIIFSTTRKLIDCFPETSEESKEHSKEILENAFDGADLEKTEGKNPANVVAGHKANLNNPRTFLPSRNHCIRADRHPVTSEESKEHSKEIVEQTKGKDPNHVASGLKA